MKGRSQKYRWFGNVLLFIMAISCATPAGLEEKRKQAEASRLLGEAYLAQENYTSALREFLKAEQIYSGDPYLYNGLGLAYMAKNQLGLAIKSFEKAIDIKPDYAPARNNLGTAYLAAKDWDQAIVCFSELTGDLLYATPHFPLSNLGLAYYNKRDFRRAEANYLKALELRPDFVLALRGLGRTYIAMGRIAAAVQAFEKAVRLAPQSSQTHFDLGHAYRLLKQYDRARNAFREVLELAPDAPIAEEARKELEAIVDF